MTPKFDSAASDTATVLADTAPTDADGDGAKAGLDCDDADPARHPGADEVCNGIDDDCDGEIDEDAIDAPAWYMDADGDGFGAGEAVAECEAALGWVPDSTDCDDADAEVYPGRDERCSTAYDDDCDGVINEPEAADAVGWAPDVDADGYGDASAAVVGCEGSEGSIADATDCDDRDAEIHPGMRDACNDGVDQDCDGTGRTCPYVGELEADVASATYAWSDAYSPYTSVQVGDVTGDGIKDILIDYRYDSVVGVAHDLATARGDLPLEAAGYFLTAEPNSPTALSGGLDYTGDGSPDLLVGFDSDGTSAYNAGRVDLIAGPITASGALPTPCATFLGEAEADVLDQGFPGADFDGDGASDLLLSTYQSGDHAGAVYLFWGPVPCTTSGAGEADVILRGEARSSLGWDTSTADLDLDGRADLVVSASGASTYTGAVRVFSSATLTAGTRDPAPDAVWEGEGGMFGIYVDASGDADGDGMPDLVSTAGSFGAGTFDQPGRVYVFYSPGLDSGLAVDADVRLDGDGHTNGGGGGHWAGDVNGDGYADLLVTNPVLDTEYGGGGTVFLFYGPVSGALSRNTDADASFEGPAGAGFGATLYQPGDYALGDVDGDGADEFMLPAIDSDSIWFFQGGL